MLVIVNCVALDGSEVAGGAGVMVMVLLMECVGKFSKVSRSEDLNPLSSALKK